MNQIYWLRAEQKEYEFRRALSPQSVAKLIKKGHEVYVEKSNQSIIDHSEYANAGATIVEQGSWQQAPLEAIIIGLKALPDHINEFKHTHIYFAHAYKEQHGWKELLSKFSKGKGKIIDLEYMLDENNRRVCAFGYWAGYVGAALACLFSNKEKRDEAKLMLKNKRSFIDKEQLIENINMYSLSQAKAIVIGALGRSGQGAQDLLKDLNWSVTAWDLKETKKGGPFKEILDFDVFVNCVLSTSKIPPFLTKTLLEENKSLKVISDVSCDPDSECNVLPLYTHATTLENPLIKLNDSPIDLNLVAIDNLPSILPKESTIDFSNQLETYLLDYDESSGPIYHSLQVFIKSIQKIG